MIILHVSAECYPMAKAGGLADVVGALPKYQNRLQHDAKVIMPMHRTSYLYKTQWEEVHKRSVKMDDRQFDYTIIRAIDNALGFELYCVDVYGLLDREKIYGYDDDSYRYLLFQKCVLDWVNQWEYLPDVIHVHDHHTGLIPFMMKYGYEYKKLAQVKTVFTIHNGEYQGWMDWDMAAYLPAFNTSKWGMLDWNDLINPLAAAVKCADKVTTVSPGYMEEIRHKANGLEKLFQMEAEKCSGILNGIDTEVWNPATDTYILDNYSSKDYAEGKALNKSKICKEFGLQKEAPLFAFIGRMVGEKGAEILPDTITKMQTQRPKSFAIFVLGSGEKFIEHELTELNGEWSGYYNSRIEYNEKLSHLLYAAADFLIMPSKVEPCGLNQMYALRYGTIPVVRRTGGLKDTITDVEDKDGFGICFNDVSVDSLSHAMNRAIDIYHDRKKFDSMIKKCMSINNSWENSAENYLKLYNSI